MAVTGLKDLDTNTQLVKVRHLIGSGNPNTDTTLGLMTDHTKFPVYSTFIDEASKNSGILTSYIKMVDDTVYSWKVMWATT